LVNSSAAVYAFPYLPSSQTVITCFTWIVVTAGCVTVCIKVRIFPSRNNPRESSGLSITAAIFSSEKLLPVFEIILKGISHSLDEASIKCVESNRAFIPYTLKKFGNGLIYN